MAATGRLTAKMSYPSDDIELEKVLAAYAIRASALVAAALTILRAWFIAGRPRMQCPAWGSFDAWSALVPPALVFAGGADPMLARPAAQGEEDPEKAALVTILTHWPKLAGANGISVKTALDALYPARHDAGPPDGYDDLREALEALTSPPPGKPPSAARVAGQLRRFKRRVVGGRMLDLVKDRTGIARWSVRTAGDAGDAGDVSALTPEDVKSGSSRERVKTSPASTASTAVGGGRE
jgi:hypothetical protein